MTIPQITNYDLANLPSTSEEETFHANAESLFEWQVGELVPQINNIATTINGALAGDTSNIVDSLNHLNSLNLYHPGNDGVGSGLDAELLDGKSSSFYRDAGIFNSGRLHHERLTFASQAQARAGAEDRTVMNPLRTKEAIESLSPFSKFYTTEPLTATSFATIRVRNHSLGVKPKLIQVSIICQAADIGYAKWDEVIVNPAFNASAALTLGQTIKFDDTSLYIRGGHQWRILRNDGTFDVTSTTIGRWRYVVSAWA